MDYIDYYVYLNKKFLCDYLKYKNMFKNLIFFWVFVELFCRNKFRLIKKYFLAETIHLHGRDVQSKGISLCFTSAYRLLFLSCYDGPNLIGHLNPDATSISKVSSVLEGDEGGQLRPAGQLNSMFFVVTLRGS